MFLLHIKRLTSSFSCSSRLEDNSNLLEKLYSQTVVIFKKKINSLCTIYTIYIVNWIVWNTRRAIIFYKNKVVCFLARKFFFAQSKVASVPVFESSNNKFYFELRGVSKSWFKHPTCVNFSCPFAICPQNWCIFLIQLRSFWFHCVCFCHTQRKISRLCELLPFSFAGSNLCTKLMHFVDSTFVILGGEEK